MRRVFIALCALIAVSSFHPAQAQTLYTFLIADTKAKGGKEAFKANVTNLKELVDEIKDVMPVKEPVVVDGNQFNCRAIAAALNRHKLGKDDAVLFHYSGNGFRTSGTFPEFDCRRTWQDRNRVGLASVANHFARAKPRLIVAMADTGNKKESRRSGPEPRSADRALPTYKGSPRLTQRQLLLKKLFRESKGIYKITAAEGGQEANLNKKGDDDNPVGGYFTNQFLAVLNALSRDKADKERHGPCSQELPQVETITWEEVLNEAVCPITLPPEAAQKQKPVWE